MATWLRELADTVVLYVLIELQLWGSWLPGSGAWLLEQNMLLVILTELDVRIVGYLAPGAGCYSVIIVY